MHLWSLSLVPTATVRSPSLDVAGYSRCAPSRHGARSMRPSPSPSAVVDPHSHSCVNYELPTRVARDRFWFMTGPQIHICAGRPNNTQRTPWIGSAQIDRVEVDVARHPRSGEGRRIDLATISGDAPDSMRSIVTVEYLR